MTTSTTAAYQLTSAEYNAGAPKIRFIDAQISGNQGIIYLDYARVVTE